MLKGSLKVEDIQNKYEQLTIYLNEKSRRLWAATEANSIGWGGIGVVSKATGMSYPTIRKGIKELLDDKVDTIRLRKKGGGRKSIIEKDKGVLRTLDKLICPYTKGDPESPLRWTSKSTYKLSKALKEASYQVSPSSVGRIRPGSTVQPRPVLPRCCSVCEPPHRRLTACLFATAQQCSPLVLSPRLKSGGRA